MWYFILAVVLLVGFVAYQRGLFDKAIAKVKDITNPAPSPVIPPMESNTLEEYDNGEALKAFLERHPDAGMVILDDVRINEGFTPAAVFYTQPDGSVKR